VKARLDASGAIHVVETQTMVFDGDWNGGERIFRVFPGQSVDLVSVTRIGRDGVRIPLVPGDLTEVDHFSWTGGKTLRWRSRLPSDPPFAHAQKVYEIAYTITGVLEKEFGRDYLLDHDFAFPDREWPMRSITVSLELDPVWKPRETFRGSWTSGELAPGRSFVVKVPLEYVGSGAPAAATGLATLFGRRTPFWLLAAVVVYAYVAWRRRETAVGRLAPLKDPSTIDEAWLGKHLLFLKPEEAGVLWDERIGPPEVAAVLARLSSEKKIATSAEGKKLTLRLLAPMSDFAGYDRELVQALFFEGRKETDTHAVKKHYKSRGFDPAGMIRPDIERELEKKAWFRDQSPVPSPVPEILLLGASVICHGLAVLLDAEPLGEAMGLAIVYGALYGIGAALAWVFRRRIQHLDAASPLILWLPALLLYLTWLGSRTSLVAALGTIFLRMAVVLSIFNLAKTRTGPRRIALRKDLALVRLFFHRDPARPAPRLSDEWFPYVVAFGLAPQAERWFRRYGGAAAATSMAAIHGGAGGGRSSSGSG
jgi:hypothetical protein